MDKEQERRKAVSENVQLRKTCEEIRTILRDRKITPEQKNLKIYDLVRLVK